MKYLFLLLMLVSCVATGPALDRQARALEDLQAKVADPTATVEAVAAANQELLAASEGVRDAVVSDTNGITNFGPEGDSVLITAAGMALLNFLRNRKYPKQKPLV